MEQFMNKSFAAKQEKVSVINKAKRKKKSFFCCFFNVEVAYLILHTFYLHRSYTHNCEQTTQLDLFCLYKMLGHGVLTLLDMLQYD